MEIHVSRILIKHLEKPDGRPLYRYKFNDEIYRLLHSYLSTTPHSQQNFLFWSGMFTLYAVEWWRREYDGGHWGWSPIFRSINKGYLDEALFRRSVIEKGFQYWKRDIQVHSNGNKSYLGSIYAECGIPNFALQVDHYFSKIITQSFKSLCIVSISEFDRLQIIKEIADKKLPQSLQREISYKLLKDIANEFIFLKDKYKLGEKTNPSVFLDNNNPGWRESFPIQLSDIGNQFIDSLLSEVQKIKTVKPHQARFIHKLVNKNNSYDISSQLLFPDKSLAYDSLGMDKEKFALLSNKAKILLISSSGTRHDLGYAFKNQDIGFRINIREFFNLPEKAHLESWQLILRDTVNHEEFEIEIPFAEALQTDTPWVFTSKNNSWFLKAEGSVKLSSSEALVVIPERSQIESDIEEIGFWENRQIVRIKEDLKVIIGDSLYKIWLRVQTEDNFYYKLSGRLFQYALGNDIFIGLPRILKVDKESLIKLFPNGKIEIKQGNAESWMSASDSNIGCVKLRLTGIEGEVLFVKTVNVLPKDFSIELKNEGKNIGQISLIGSDLFSIALLSEDKIEGEISKTDKGHIITLTNLEDIKIQEARIKLTPQYANPIHLNIPIPKESFNILNPENEVLPPNALLHVDELHGFKLSIFNNKAKSINSIIRLELFDLKDHSIQIGITRKIKVTEYSNKHKPLIDFVEDIKRLLSFGSLDAIVKLACDNHSISIRNYSLSCYFDRDTNLFKVNSLMNKKLLVKIQAFRVDRPISDGEFYALEFDENEDAWRIPESFNNRGNWIIYPAKNSTKQFRPVLAPKEDPVSGLTHIENIHEAGLIKNSDERIGLLKAFYDYSASNFEHSSWNELNILWENTSHLPCKTFDVWNALVKSDAGLVTAFLKLNGAAISNLTEEYTINWLLIPVKIWLETIRSYKSYLEGFNLDDEILKSLLSPIIDRIKSELNLSFVGELLEFQVLSESPPQGFMLNEVLLKVIIKDGLMGQQNRAGLIGRHTLDGEWPDELQIEIVKMFHKLPYQIKQLFPVDLISYSKSVTYLPAIFAVQSVSQGVNEISNLDSLMRYRFFQIIEFDQEWHYNTFNYVQGYYWKLIYEQSK